MPRFFHSSSPIGERPTAAPPLTLRFHPPPGFPPCPPYCRAAIHHGTFLIPKPPSAFPGSVRGPPPRPHRGLSGCLRTGSPPGPRAPGFRGSGKVGRPLRRRVVAKAFGPRRAESAVAHLSVAEGGECPSRRRDSHDPRQTDSMRQEKWEGATDFWARREGCKSLGESEWRQARHGKAGAAARSDGAETNAASTQALGTLASRRRIQVGNIEDSLDGWVDEALAQPGGSARRRDRGALRILLVPDNSGMRPAHPRGRSSPCDPV